MIEKTSGGIERGDTLFVRGTVVVERFEFFIHEANQAHEDVGVFRERGAAMRRRAHFLEKAEGAEAEVCDLEGVVGGLLGVEEGAGGFDEEA